MMPFVTEEIWQHLTGGQGTGPEGEPVNALFAVWYSRFARSACALPGRKPAVTTVRWAAGVSAYCTNAATFSGTSVAFAPTEVNVRETTHFGFARHAAAKS